jgi:dihydrolipoamide dehydrogenase
MGDRFDVIVLGMGPGGEVAAGRLLAAGKRVALIERELIGGECAYWACIPSKTLLRSPEARHQASMAAGLNRPDLDWPALRDYRDWMIRHLDDTAQVRHYEKRGGTVIRAAGRLAGPGRVDADGRPLHAEHIIIATGSRPVRPPIQGLDQVPVWTSREATTLTDVPGRALLLGGGPVGVELGQFLARMGTKVTIVQRAEQLLDREDPRVGELARDIMQADGVEVRTGRQAARVRPSDDGRCTLVDLDDGTTVATDVIVLGAGRRPNVDDLNLDSVGVTPGAGGALPVDEHCRLADGLWAVGDVTGVALFTHLAKYQGRVVADTITGVPRRASYDGIPRVVFTDPEIATVGLTQVQARQRGLDVVTAEIDLTRTIARPWIYQTQPTGTLCVLVDRRRGVLVGAWAVAPLASEWIHQAALAIRAQIPLNTLLDGVAQFPTYSEGYLKALESLPA